MGGALRGKIKVLWRSAVWALFWEFLKDRNQKVFKDKSYRSWILDSSSTFSVKILINDLVGVAEPLVKDLYSVI